jgi:hypothetical protein
VTTAVLVGAVAETGEADPVRMPANLRLMTHAIRAEISSEPVSPSDSPAPRAPLSHLVARASAAASGFNGTEPGMARVRGHHVSRFTAPASALGRNHE